MKPIIVLSIDDSKAIHAFMDLSFPKDKYSLIHAYSALEGIEILKKDADKISIILLDWEMPGMNGPEALVEMRRLGIKLPIIMVTTKNDPSEIGEMLDKGANEFVMKPFTPDIIQEKVDALIKETNDAA